MCPRFGLIAWLKEWRYGQSNQNFFIDILSRCTTSIDLNPNQFMSYIHRAVVKLVLLKIYSVEYIDLKDSNDAKIKITFNDFQDSQKKKYNCFFFSSIEYHFKYSLNNLNGKKSYILAFLKKN